MQSSCLRLWRYDSIADDPNVPKESASAKGTGSKGRRPLNKVLKRLLLVFIPIIITVVFIMTLFFVLERTVFEIIGGAMVGYTLSPFGPEIVIPFGIGLLYGVHASHLTFLLVFSVVFVDIIIAFFMLLNFELVEAMPLLGRWVRKSEEIFSKKLKKRRETIALSALVLYVAMPFQGSGGFVGSIMGRVVGLNKYKVFFAVTIGSILGAVPIGLAAHYGMFAVLRALETGELLYKLAGISIIIIFIIVIVYFIRREKSKRANEIEDKEEHSEGEEKNERT